jgi:Na+/proline symporter
MLVMPPETLAPASAVSLFFATTILPFAAPAVAAIGLTYYLYWSRKSASAFYVAEHSVGRGLGVLATSSAWTWVVALFFVPMIVYRQGAPAMVAFVLVNAAVLWLFGYLATPIRKAMPNGETLPQFLRMRAGKATEVLFAVAQMMILTYIIILPLTVASMLVLYLTGKADTALMFGSTSLQLKTVILLALAFGIYAVAWPRGHQSSLMTHVVKSVAVALFVYFGLEALAAGSGGSWRGTGETLLKGLQGTRGADASLVPWASVVGMIIPTSLALVASAMMDAMLYQTMFSLRRDAVRGAFAGGAVIFLGIVATAASLGLLAAGLGVTYGKGGNQSGPPDLVAFHMIERFVSNELSLVFATILIAAILATGVAALNAQGSIVKKHLLEPVAARLRISVTDWGAIQFSRTVMLAVLLVAVWAAHAGWELFTWWLSAGAVRAVIAVPLLALILTPKETLPSAVGWMAIIGVVAVFAYLFGTGFLPSYDLSVLQGTGKVFEGVHRSGTNWAIMAAFASGFALWGVHWAGRQLSR